MASKPAERDPFVNMQFLSRDVQTSKPPPNHARRRRRLRLPGKIIFGTRRFALDCIIRDLFADGARIIVSHPDHLPIRFVLIEPKNDLAFNAKIEWRRGKFVGLTFEGAISLAGGLTGEHQLLRMHSAAAKREWRL